VGASLKQWGIDEVAAKLIKRKARHAIGKAGLNRSDREDLEQDLVVELLAWLPKYDPSKASRETFIATVLDSKISNILRHRRADMRYCGREEFSLNETIDDGDGRDVARAETLSTESAQRYESPDDVLARIDMEEAVSKLPAGLRALYDQLQQLPLSEAAQRLGIPLSTAWSQLLKLRAALRAAGVCEEFHFPSESEASAGHDPQ